MTPETSTADIPLIDIAPLYSEDPSDWVDVARHIDHACQRTGFFYVKGHTIDTSTMNDVVGMAKQLFAQPMGEKLKIDITQSAHHRGYGAIATEQLDPSLPGDCKETFDMGRHLLADDPDVLAEKPLHGPNRYPEIDGFQATMETHYWRMLELGKTILKGIAVALGIAPDYFDSRFTHPISVLRFIHYPPASALSQDNQIGAGAHTDYGCITILYQDEVGGLQVQNRQGDWIDATPVPDTFVINIGDMMARWSNDRYTSTPHRVVNQAQKDRYASPFFVEPNFDTNIYCLDGCSDQTSPPKYESISAGEYLLSRFRDTYAYRQKR
ncbi:2OG-Fe(II) oxygenase [Neptunomonas sp. CHC150]|uniref:isopenicillin N synthase family dioxygenase n=1 Tax=Neptunomonas TaxID=75687 RepID=UPI001BE8CCAD|nr:MULTISPECIES: 2-oxoglutarate and iron-dependent oxygenase domain-containing protein [Neptunomonas]MBT3145627.1 2OG-Fe(II) oxygenase [Neptunomonas phycophila]MDN2660121.1 2OG-Fe(II) oxygenase [Neptunomonas sp. CHC150]